MGIVKVIPSQVSSNSEVTGNVTGAAVGKANSQVPVGKANSQVPACEIGGDRIRMGTGSTGGRKQKHYCDDPERFSHF